MRTKQLSMPVAGDVTGGLAIAARFADRGARLPIDPNFPASAVQLSTR